MPEIKPDLSDKSRCPSVHWTLPVQCVLPSGHRENWHEAWHPQSRNRIRYRRSMGVFATEELHDDRWNVLGIPPPGGHCGYPYPGVPEVTCREQYGHHMSWCHRATVDGCQYTWNTPLPHDLTAAQLDHDVRQVRGLAYRQERELAELQGRAGEALAVLNELIADHPDPGTRALAAQSSLGNALLGAVTGPEAC